MYYRKVVVALCAAHTKKRVCQDTQLQGGVLYKINNRIEIVLLFCTAKRATERSCLDVWLINSSILAYVQKKGRRALQKKVGTCDKNISLAIGALWCTI